jgi:hypothetical protein
MNFAGIVRSRETVDDPYPDLHTLFPALEARLARVTAALGGNAGIDVAAPLWLGG